MTQKEILIKKHGSIRAASAALGIPESTLRQRLAKKEPAELPGAKERTSYAGGISLKEHIKVRSSRPSEGVKKKLFSLRRGVGVPVNELADTWGVSPGTLQAHARRHDCLRYVEIGPGDWVQCVLHPETAAEHGGD